jgi:hypothetical protein
VRHDFVQYLPLYRSSSLSSPSFDLSLDRQAEDDRVRIHGAEAAYKDEEDGSCCTTDATLCSPRPWMLTDVTALIPCSLELLPVRLGLSHLAVSDGGKSHSTFEPARRKRSLLEMGTVSVGARSG